MGNWTVLKRLVLLLILAGAFPLVVLADGLLPPAEPVIQKLPPLNLETTQPESTSQPEPSTPAATMSPASPATENLGKAEPPAVQPAVPAPDKDKKAQEKKDRKARKTPKNQQEAAPLQPSSDPNAKLVSPSRPTKHGKPVLLPSQYMPPITPAQPAPPVVVSPVKPIKPVAAVQKPERTPQHAAVTKTGNQSAKKPEPAKVKKPEPAKKTAEKRNSKPRPNKPKEKPVVHFPELPAPQPAVVESKPVPIPSPAKAPKSISKKPVAKPLPVPPVANKPAPQSKAKPQSKPKKVTLFQKKPAPPPSPHAIYINEEANRHFQTANRLVKSGEFGEAMQEYQNALLLNPTFADAHVGLAAGYARKSDWERVIEESQEAIRLKAYLKDPGNLLKAYYNLSTAYCVVDDGRQARHYLRLVEKAKHPFAGQLKTYLDNNCQ